MKQAHLECCVQFTSLHLNSEFRPRTNGISHLDRTTEFALDYNL